MRVRIKGINKITKKLASGKIEKYYYLRGFGRLKPLPGDEKLPFRPGTIAFMRSYQALVSGGQSAPAPTKIQKTLFDLISSYRSSGAFTKLKPRTQRDYTVHIDKILAKWGTLPIAALNDVEIRPLFFEWHDELSKSSPRQADMTLTIFGTILQWALDQGRISHNYAARVKKGYKADRSDMIWLPEHQEAFLKHATPEMRLAMILAIDTGQRQGDLLNLTWENVKTGRLILTQSKRGRKVDMPITKRLKEALDEARLRGHNTDLTDHILVSSQQCPWSADGFRGAWDRVFVKAGLKPTKLHFHDLRGTTCTMLAEAGCDDEQIGAVLGWKRDYVAQMRSVYQAANKNASNLAIDLLEASAK